MAVRRKRCDQGFFRRGFDTDTLDHNRIGADPGHRHLPRPHGLPPGHGVAAVFSIRNHTGELTYVQARYLHPHNGHRYDNPSRHLAPHAHYGYLHPAHPDRFGTIVVCEGVPDALTAATAGHPAIAILGAHTPTDRLARELAAAHEQVTIVGHPDTAGRHLTTSLHDQLTARGVDVHITPPADHDLNSWAITTPTWRHHLTLERQPTAITQEVGIEVDL